ncbi:hypothetical protein B0T25DRAFT_573160 [Lasiosphaeria hispida]|uniref:C2H2-type domain-containing protein n=1 Tax=Lasiosphaeria hispida TaxID=260671 RepID=A0AAJ0H9C5_9PEZI|nr:hypothetical protein B0T25DRAFT_573160 [Lasiosphaeria hispida]
MSGYDYEDISNFDHESDDDDDDDDDDGNDDDDDDTDMFTTPSRRYPLLDPYHRFACFKDSLVDVALAGFSPVLQHLSERRRWNDKTPPSPPMTRCGSTADLAEIGDLMRTTNNTNGFVTEQISPAKLGLACPFFAHNPTKHRSCLKQDLRSIIEVKRHLWTTHRRPYYCPICGIIFDTSGGCNNHTRRRQCQHRTFPKPGGLSKYQLDQLGQLAHPPNQWQSEKLQWFLIWDTVFPGDGQPPPPPYLSNAIDSVRRLGWLRDYWEGNGQRVLEDALSQEGIYEHRLPREKRNLKALQGLVLEKMMDRLLDATR